MVNVRETQAERLCHWVHCRLQAGRLCHHGYDALGWVTGCGKPA